MSASIDIRLNRPNKIYFEDDIIQGTVIITAPTAFKHNGITLTVDGSVQLHLSGKTVGVFDAFYKATKPVTLIDQVIELAKPGQVNANKTEIPFQVPLKNKFNKPLYETYHGVFVNIQYFLRVDVKRTFFSKDMNKQLEFNVEYSRDHLLAAEKATTKPASFEITTDSIKTIHSKIDVPKFKLTGHLDSLSCLLTSPFVGEPDCTVSRKIRVCHQLLFVENRPVTVQVQRLMRTESMNWLTLEESEIAIKSIEVQLLRVETCGCAEGFARETTEIQNIQVADGDVARHVPIPIWMVFPRIFTCPTLASTNFRIEFEVNIVLVFADNRMVSDNFPIQLCRY